MDDFKSYFVLKNGMFLPSIILPIAARADFKLWRARTALKGQEWQNQWKSSIVVSGIQIMWKFWISGTTRARTRTDGKFGNALNDLVRAQNCL